jgi:hypothetical protein
MKIQIISFLLLAGWAMEARATIPVIDYSHIAQDAGNEVVNLGKWIKTEVDAAQTQLNTLNTYENTVLQVARMGNPATLKNLPGVSTVAELYSIYGQLTRDYQQIQDFTNPQRYQNDLNYILSTYRQPNWNGFASASGYNISPLQGNYQFSTASWNVANNVEQQLSALDHQRQRLQQQRDAALQSLQSASTQSDVQKYHAVLDGINGALAEVGQATSELYHRSALKAQELAAGQQIYNASQAEQRAAAAYRGIDTDLSALPANQFRQGAQWGMDTATVGSDSSQSIQMPSNTVGKVIQ